MKSLRKDAEYIIREAIAASLPDAAVADALADFKAPHGKLVLVALGKAAWQMANAACRALGDRIDCGIVITKYGHVVGDLPNIECCEAGHPVPDENSYSATGKAMELVRPLGADDEVLFLISGGGSALFESPLVPPCEMACVTKKLLASGADIVEMNTVRKRLSAVKGGRFAQLCAPARVFSVVLSDIIGDPLDMIASGPAYPDSSSCEDAFAVMKKYNIPMSENVKKCLGEETPKQLSGVETRVTGSVRLLCEAAADACRRLGYETVLLTSSMQCIAKEVGGFLGSVGRSHAADGHSVAFIAGGETVVKCTGQGLGGRNQEIALAAAHEIAGLDNVAVFSVGSDGTDGPTDAAGGYCDGSTETLISGSGKEISDYLEDNDSYHALEKSGGLIKTGPTGTNVNDFSAVLIKGM